MNLVQPMFFFSLLYIHGRVPFEFLDGGVIWDDAELGDIRILRWWRYTEN